MNTKTLINEIMTTMAEYQEEVLTNISDDLVLSDLPPVMIQSILEQDESIFFNRLSADAQELLLILINRHTLPQA